MSRKYTREEILKFLRRISVMSIAVSNDNKPISSVVVFYVDNDFAFYFVTRKDTHKAKALHANPQISLSVWEHEKMLVQASGKVREVEDANEFENIMDKIVAQTSELKDFWWPILSIQGSEYIIFKVQTEWLRALDLSDLRVKDETPFYNIDLHNKE